MDQLQIGRVNACEMAFKIDQALWKLLIQIVLFQDKKRAKELFWSLRKQGKNRFQVEENRRAHA